MSELHNALQTDDLRGKGWWSSYQALSKHLKSSKASLRAAGVDVGKSDGKKRSPISGKPCVLFEVRIQPSADE